MIAAALGDKPGARLLMAQALEINPYFDLLQAAEARRALDALSAPEAGGPQELSTGRTQ
jgi:hypothetical protein